MKGHPLLNEDKAIKVSKLAELKVNTVTEDNFLEKRSILHKEITQNYGQKNQFPDTPSPRVVSFEIKVATLIM